MEYLVSVHYAIETEEPLDEPEKLQRAVMQKMVQNLRNYVMRNEYTVVVDVVDILGEKEGD